MHKLLAGLSLLIACPAWAAHWVVDPAQSRLTFTGMQSGQPFQGSFARFTSEIDFSEAAPEKGRIHVTVDMASATTDDKDRMEALPTKDWFATAHFPKAEFTSRTIRKTGAHQYEAQGTLTIREVTQDATLPFTLRPSGAQTLAEGSLTLQRNLYHVGQGQWASDQWIAYPVTVEYRIFAAAEGK